jgi:glycosyltransferase involved in cell wall biosynthesis
MTDDRLNLITIPSKGRPKCTTAEYLEKVGYPGEYRIIVGTNDDTAPEYVERWGDRVVMFDWAEEAARQDMLDPFGIEGSGVITARNFAARAAAEMGYLRFWEMDDDINCFYINDPEARKNRRIEDGQELFDRLNELSEWAHRIGCARIVCQGNSTMFPDSCLTVAWYGCLVMNQPTEGHGFVEFRGRVSEDIINIADIYKSGSFCIRCNWLGYALRPTMTEKGGSTDLYLTDAGSNTRRMSYFTLLAPLVAGADKRLLDSGDIKFKNEFKWLIPKMVSDRFVRTGDSAPRDSRRRVALLGYDTCNLNGIFVGGTERMTDILIRYFKDAGYNVLYVCTNNVGGKKKAYYKSLYGVEVVSGDEAVERDRLGRFNPDLIFISTVFFEKMRPLFEQAVEVARNVPTILYSHGINVCKAKHLPDGIFDLDTVHFTALNESDRRQWLDNGVPEDRVHDVRNTMTVPDGLEPNTDYRYDIVLNARPTTQKGAMNTARLCKELGYRVAFVGGGSSDSCSFYAEIKGLLGDMATFYGHIPQDEVFEVVRSAKFMCFLPNSEEGSSPLAVLEAMALGTPIITWDRFGMSRHVDSEHNIVLSGRESFIDEFRDRYAGSLDRYLDVRSRSELMHRTVETYGLPAYHRQIDELIQDATGWGGNAQE